MKQRSAESLATHQLRNEKGASMVEYALLAALIAVGAMGSVSNLGNEARKSIEAVGQELAAANINPVNPCTRNCPPP